jgi:hypothetical protein
MYHCLSLSSTRLELNEFFGIRTEEWTYSSLEPTTLSTNGLREFWWVLITYFCSGRAAHYSLFIFGFPTWSGTVDTSLSLRVWTLLSILDMNICMSEKGSEKECHVERGCGNCAPQGWPLSTSRVTSNERHVILNRRAFTQFDARRIGEQHFVCCWKDLCICTAFWPHHPTLRVGYRAFGICSIYDAFWVSVIDVDLECGVLVGSTPYSGFYSNPVQPTAWAEDTYVGSTLRSFSMSLTTSSLDSSNDENIQLRTLG